jgi:hypothetical protein
MRVALATVLKILVLNLSAMSHPADATLQGAEKRLIVGKHGAEEDHVCYIINTTYIGKSDARPRCSVAHGADVEQFMSASRCTR